MDESGGIHIYQFATEHQASEFIRQVKDLADIFWEQYNMETSSVREALEEVKDHNEEVNQ
jgi:hypothetical protein